MIGSPAANRAFGRRISLQEASNRTSNLQSNVQPATSSGDCRTSYLAGALRASVAEVGIETPSAIAAENGLPANGFGAIRTPLHLLAEHALETRHAVLNSKDQ